MNSGTKERGGWQTKRKVEVGGFIKRGRHLSWGLAFSTVHCWLVLNWTNLLDNSQTTPTTSTPTSLLCKVNSFGVSSVPDQAGTVDEEQAEDDCEEQDGHEDYQKDGPLRQRKRNWKKKTEITCTMYLKELLSRLQNTTTPILFSLALPKVVQCNMGELPGNV